MSDSFSYQLLPNFEEDSTCNELLATLILECDSYHHNYHYQSSLQYLWLAQTYIALGDNEGALAAYERAIFQDHYNGEAITGKASLAGEQTLQASIPLYDKHPISAAEFCHSIGKQPDAASLLHDEAVEIFIAGDFPQVLALLEDCGNCPHSLLLKGKSLFMLGSYLQARDCLLEAIRLSHIEHDAYHKSASNEHLQRGYRFLASENLDLAIVDFSKALDLDKHNAEARKARADTYRRKGSIRLAEEDEAELGLS